MIISTQSYIYFRNLQSNLIPRISKSVFSNLESLTWLNILENPINEIEFESFRSSNAWTAFKVNSHGFLCDCNLTWFCKFLQSNKQLFDKLNPPRCTKEINEGSEFAERSLFNVNPKSLKCDKNAFLRPVISSHPKSRSIEDGDAAKFECKVKTSEIDSTKIEWQIRREADKQWLTLTEDPNLYQMHTSPPGGANADGTDGGGASKGNIIESTLFLPSVGDDAKGAYRCKVTNNVAEAISQNAILDVYILPQFTYTPRNKTVSLGKKVDLTCDAAIGIPTPKIYWQRANDITFWNRYDESSAELAEKMMIKGNSREPSIKLQNIGPEDSGKYTCVAENSAGRVSHDVYISMKPMQHLIEYSHSVKSTLGENAMLSCKYPPVYPPVTVFWYYGNKTITSESSHHFLSEHGEILIIDNAQKSDSGLYQCQVKNEIGSATGSINLKILDESQFESELPKWIWILAVGLGAILVTSLIWLVVFCKTRMSDPHGLSDIGTGSTPLNEIPSPMERHLNDNQKYHQIQQSQNNRFEEMSSSVTMTSSSEKSQGLYRAKTPTSGHPFGPSGPAGLNGPTRHSSNGYYPYNSPYLSYNPMPYGVPSPYPPQYSPYINPYLQLAHQPLLPAVSVPGLQTPTHFLNPHEDESKSKSGAGGGSGFGPDPPGTPTRNPTNYQAPYRAPVIPIVPTNVGRARTLPDLDARSSGTGHGPGHPGPANMENGFGQVMLPPLIPQPPHFNAHASFLPPSFATPTHFAPGYSRGIPLHDDTDLIRSAPGPDRRRGRRSEGNHLTRKLLFKSNLENQRLAAEHNPRKNEKGVGESAKVQIADESGIVNRVLGPAETSQ